MNYDHLRAIALHGVVKDTDDFQLRSILRWYSKTFHTPLHEVDDLPLDHILTSYYESTYEDMKPPELEDAIAEILLSPEERKKRANEKARQDAEAEDYAKKVEKAQPKALPEVIPTQGSLMDQLKAFKAQLKNAQTPKEEGATQFDVPPDEDP